MVGLVIDRMSHALLAHHLETTGSRRSMEDLPNIVENAAMATFGALRYGHGQNSRFATEKVKAATGYKLVDFTRRDIGPIDLPPLAAQVRRDEDGDLMFRIRELALADGARLWRRTQRDPYSLLVPGRMPETLMVGLAGRPLAEVAAHPATDGLGIHIELVREMGTYWGDLVLPTRPGPHTVITLRKFGNTIINGG